MRIAHGSSIYGDSGYTNNIIEYDAMDAEMIKTDYAWENPTVNVKMNPG